MRLTADSSVILGLVAVSLGVASLLLMPSQIDGYALLAVPDARSPAFFPGLISLFLVLIGVLLAWQGLSGRVPRGAEQDRPEQPARVLTTLAIILGYAVLIFVTGFYVASALLVAALAPTLGYRRYRSVAVAAAGITLVVYVLFERNLNVFLPGPAGF